MFPLGGVLTLPPSITPRYHSTMGTRILFSRRHGLTRDLMSNQLFAYPTNLA